MNDSQRARLPWQALAAECVGTALLVLVGLSLVILMFGPAALSCARCRTKDCGG